MKSRLLIPKQVMSIFIALITFSPLFALTPKKSIPISDAKVGKDSLGCADSSFQLMPICSKGLSINLLPDTNSSAQFTLHAADFVASPIFSCYGQGPDTLNGMKLITQYSINRIGERVRQNKSTLNLTCADAGKVILIELHAWDTRGKDGYCVTYVEVQDLKRYCVSEPLVGYITGIVETEEYSPVQGIKMDIRLDSLPYQFATTNLNGAYSFVGLPRGKSVLLEPKLDKNPLNGVSTFDLLLIQKHILGIQALNSPYKMIAADVNNSKTISTADLIQLRKLILNLNSNFPNNTSWRFVHAAFKFPKPENPWATQFAESIFVKEFNGGLPGNFIAIKIGDINSSAKVDGASNNE
jgi:large repetitive protein